MAASNRLAKDRIINTLGDLYRVQRHTQGLSATEKASVEASIDGLEQEYLALLGFNEGTTYASVTQAFKDAETNLQEVKDERIRMANYFVSASKLLGSITQVLKLF